MSLASDNANRNGVGATSQSAATGQHSTWRSQWVVAWKRRIEGAALDNRILLLALGHALVFAVAYWAAFLLRFDFRIPDGLDGNVDFVGRLWRSLPAVLGIKLFVFYTVGHLHGWWRYVTFSDLMALLRATAFSLLTLVLINHYAMDGAIPRSVVIVDSLLATLILGAMRASLRFYREQMWFHPGKQRLAIMVGADYENGVLAHQIHSHQQLPYRIAGFVDDDRSRHGRRLGGMPVFGSVNEVSEIALRCKANDVLVMAGHLSGSQLRQVMDICDEADLGLKIVPSVVDQMNGNGNRIPVRDVQINDLLGRDPVALDMQSISQDVANKTVMVTGAGGSIGSEICRQLLQFKPARLVLVDNGENAVFLINNELLREAPDSNLRPYVADVLDQDRMRQIFDTEQPDLVLHAAAHKHVGLMESNVGQCVRNNVFGTKTVADLAREFDTDKFVLISTDKAVNPTSVMGASKQIAERYIHSLAQESTNAFIVVRFGNVLGSNGSVVPLFKEQIQRGGPITVTDERMTRFFMTIPEASQLVLQAAAMGKGGEIFVLEMGEQIKIADLAKDLIRLSGLPSDAIEIKYVGIRPGEKLFEELYFDEEESLETSHPKLRAAYHRSYSVAEVLVSIEQLGQLLDSPDSQVRRKLKEIVPEYTPPAEHTLNLSQVGMPSKN